MLKEYDAYLNLSILAQEQALLKVIVDTTPYELFWALPLGRLNSFATFYGDTVPSEVSLVESRQLLLQWYSTASIIRYLGQTRPNFLIPPLPPQKRSPQWVAQKTRYELYREGKSYDSDPVPDDAPDAFERVQGRFLERFLEGIPLLLGYAELPTTPSSSPPTTFLFTNGAMNC